MCMSDSIEQKNGNTISLENNIQAEQYCVMIPAGPQSWLYSIVEFLHAVSLPLLPSTTKGETRHLKCQKTVCFKAYT